MNQWGFMVDSHPAPPRDLEATSTVKYYSVSCLKRLF